MITNKTRRKVLAGKHRTARGFFSKGIGLSMRIKHPGYALVFPFRKPGKVALTMLFVFFPIDVLFLDEQNKVVEIKRDFRPWTNYVPEKKAQTIIELESGAADSVRVGDQIEIS